METQSRSFDHIFFILDLFRFEFSLFFMIFKVDFWEGFNMSLIQCWRFFLGGFSRSVRWIF